MDCGCIKGHYDFRLSSTSNKELLYQDLSIWMPEEDGYTVPETYDVTVKTPTNIEFTATVFTTGVTKISPDSVGTFLDGIYCFATTSCGQYFPRNKAYIPTLECCLADLIAKAKTKEDFDVTQDLKFYIDSIYINAELGKPQKANEFFELVEEKMEQLNCNCFHK